MLLFVVIDEGPREPRRRGLPGCGWQAGDVLIHEPRRAFEALRLFAGGARRIAL